MTGICASTPYPDPRRNPRTAGHRAEELTPIHPDPCSNPHTAGGQAQYSDPFLPNPRTDPRTAAHRAHTAQMPLPDPHSPESTATVTDTTSSLTLALTLAQQDTRLTCCCPSSAIAVLLAYPNTASAWYNCLPSAGGKNLELTHVGQR